MKTESLLRDNATWLQPRRKQFTKGTVNSGRVISADTTTHFSAVKYTADSSDLLSRANSVQSDVHELHQEALLYELSTRTQRLVSNSVKQLLETIGDQGFSWRDIARLLDVSVPAIQKWRRGEGVAGENRRRLAALIAAVDMIASQFAVQDIPSWFETPIHDRIPVTPISVWSSGDYEAVLLYSSGRLTSEEILDRFEPGWRDKWRSEFETFRAEDGFIGIRPRS